MSSKINGANGIQRLVEKYKQDFRISENLEYYAIEDFARAERGYVQFCLKNGGSGPGAVADS